MLHPVKKLKLLFRKTCRTLLNTMLQEEQQTPFLAHDPNYSKFQIGEWSYGKPNIIADVDGPVLKIGKFCSIAEGVVILLGSNHRIDWITTYPFSVLFEDASGFPGHPSSKGDILIGHDVWIGREAIILSGVTVGNGAVIAARSVVTRDVAPYSVVAGNPARHLKYRFPEQSIEKLQQIAWWDWPLTRIKAAWPLLLSPDIEPFIAKYSGQSGGIGLFQTSLNTRPPSPVHQKLAGNRQQL
jgi:acetyltransferase-like isoleucine patch superfamily enzyme